jgi:NAD(P)-dependent dehydrogenase (short-subunit alcohol dehydrogenase family)
MRGMANDMMGKVVLVTGGSSGIGRSIASKFLSAGADVVICSRHEPKSLPGAKEGKPISWVPCDLTNIDDIDRLFVYIQSHFEQLDVLVNNAGGTPYIDTSAAAPHHFERVVALNLVAPMNTCQYAHALMRQQDAGGVIINVASVSGIRPSPGTMAYGAAKAGLLNLTNTLAVEWAPNIRVNAVTPGMIATEKAAIHYGDDAARRRISRTVPAGRMGSPGDVAEAVFFLASDQASYITGANIVIHGGGERPAFLGALND